jgi:predicted nucleic acid-binding protein
MEDIMSEKIKRVYVDSTVVSGMFDYHMPERVEQTGRFWQAVINGEVRIIASDVLDEESGQAPQHVQDFYEGLPESQIERVVSTKESNRLAAQYIAENIVGESSLDDCRHIALATITEADVIVSWNLRHIVNENRIPKYNTINEKQGYKRINITTPDKYSEVNHDET